MDIIRLDNPNPYYAQKLWASRIVTLVGLAAILVGAIYLRSINQESLSQWNFWVLGGGILSTVAGLICLRKVAPNPGIYNWRTLIKLRDPKREICKYSRKSLTATQKMEKQTKLAADSAATSKKDPSFEVTQDLSIVNSQVKGEGFGIAAAKGKGDYMEDVPFAQHLLLNGHEAQIYCVCDGHRDGGTAGALLRERLAYILVDILRDKPLTDENIGDAFTTAVEALHMEFLLNGKRKMGTTMTLALQIQGITYVANAGDSRAVFAADEGRVVQLSEDAEVDERFAGYKKGKHSLLSQGARVDSYLHPENSYTEANFTHQHLCKARDNEGHEQTIETYMGAIDGERIYTNGGTLNVSRSIGDKGLDCRPKISKSFLANGYLVLASDGLTKFMSNEDVVFATNLMKSQGLNESEMAAQLVQAAYNRGSKDNISVIVVRV